MADIAAGMYAYSRHPGRPLRAGADRRGHQPRRGHAGRARRVDEPAVLLQRLRRASGPPDRRPARVHLPVRPVRRRGGGQVFLGLQNEREWAVLCEQILRRPDLVADRRFATNPDRVAHDGELTQIIEAALAAIPAGQLASALDEAGIANARLRTPAEFAAHPQLRPRDRWRAVDTPGGPIRALLPPVNVPGREAAWAPSRAGPAHRGDPRGTRLRGRGPVRLPGPAEVQTNTQPRNPHRQDRQEHDSDQSGRPARRYHPPALSHGHRRPAGAGRLRAAGTRPSPVHRPAVGHRGQTLAPTMSTWPSAPHARHCTDSGPADRIPARAA